MEDMHTNTETEDNEIPYGMDEDSSGEPDLTHDNPGAEDGSDMQQPLQMKTMPPNNLRTMNSQASNTEDDAVDNGSAVDDIVDFYDENKDAIQEKFNDGKSGKTRQQNTNGPSWLMHAMLIMIGFFIGATIVLLSTKLNRNDRVDSIPTQEKPSQYEIIYRDNGDVSDIVEAAMDSIVSVTSTSYYQQFNFFTGMQSYEVPSSGSGIIIEKDDSRLYIATNNHVVEGTNSLTIEFSDGNSAPAAVNGSSSDSDVAVLTVELSDLKEETLGALKVASLHTDDDLKVGNQVIAIGNALGYGQSVTVGYISALDRTIQSENREVSGLIQTDAAINPGNSGGALLNMNGEVIGINVAKYSSTEVEGMGYSIPISKIRELISMLSREKFDENERGYLGIQCSTIDQSISSLYDMPQGVFIYKITNPGLATDGMFEKDIITAIDEHSVKNASDLSALLEYYKKGNSVKVSVKRLEDGKYVDKTLTVTLVGKDDADIAKE